MASQKYRYEPCGTCGTPGKRRLVNGPYLRAQRQRLGMELRVLAAALHVTKQFLSQIETNGVVCPERIRLAYERLGESAPPRRRK